MVTRYNYRGLPLQDLIVLTLKLVTAQLQPSEQAGTMEKKVWIVGGEQLEYTASETTLEILFICPAVIITLPVH